MNNSTRTDGTNYRSIRHAFLLPMAAIALLAVSYTNQVGASDRDTPSYMIYVDPITGKYSTKPPEDGNGTSVQGPNDNGTDVQSAQQNSPGDTRAPMIAILLLAGAALISLLAKGRSIS